MNKDEQQKKKRAEFVTLAFLDNKQAAKNLKQLAKGLENCRNTQDTICALKEILFLSESTIFRDINNLQDENASE